MSNLLLSQVIRLMRVPYRARAEQAGYVIKLQHTIITLTMDSSTDSIITLPSLPTILASSEENRVGVVGAIGEQYQRMLQAQPLISSLFLIIHG